MNKEIGQWVVTLIILIGLSTIGQAIAEWETTTYHWAIDEVPSGQETVFVPQPVEVEIENTGIKTSISDSAEYEVSRLV